MGLEISLSVGSLIQAFLLQCCFIGFIVVSKVFTAARCPRAQHVGPGMGAFGTAAVEELEDFINNINSVLESLYIEIKKGATEDDGRPVYALVNLATTPVSKMASDFAENELDLFRKALELIIDSETGFASSTNILNLVDQLKGKKMRKKEAEQVLQKFVQNKWLIEKEGEFTLHSRAILEMEQYIRETYPDAVKTCNICHGLLIQGQSCETCGIRMHLPCVAKYFQSAPEPRCPHCNDYWPHEIPGSRPSGARGQGGWGTPGDGEPSGEGSARVGLSAGPRPSRGSRSRSKQTPVFAHACRGPQNAAETPWLMRLMRVWSRRDTPTPGPAPSSCMRVGGEGGARSAGRAEATTCPAAHGIFRPLPCTEVFNPDKEREAGTSKANKKPSRSRQH
ncbi:non-structural maintenance of chromosomes element 1 homolog isoform X3 [Lynx rufus]|uniref:non-structural maintenance of chromosomes element 1 homolog isoform X3 n=2 Tax=Lynx rufus TaxID=61384 RepID=UPI001F127C30|nr:non-structural maintenance of chromosomes element 1 homolog isoform X3 [Lynx rufus]